MCAAITCAVSDYDASIVAEFLKVNGHDIVSSPENADMIFINTCGSDEYREGKSFSLIHEMFENFSKSKKVVVFGCLVKERSDFFKDMPGVTLIGPKEFHKFNSLIGAKVPIEEVRTNEVIDINQKSSDPSNYDYRNSRFISISKGCKGKCSFCIIKRAKGNLLSKPLDRILEEFDSVLAKGGKDVVLLADDAGCYGADIGTDLGSLLSEMLKREGDYRITLHYLEPGWLVKLYPKLRKAFESNKVTCVNIPIQSGSKRILSLMKRDYDISELLRVVADIKRISKAHLATDIVFGFPTETSKDFMESVKVANVFDEVIFNIFSARPGTQACNIQPKVSEEERRDMLRTILKLRSSNPKKYVLSCLGYYNV